MKKALFIGMTCLTAGTIMAGCGASTTQPAETTLTAEETTTSAEITHIIPTDLKVGDVITFGNYPQETDGTNKPIEWQVLDVKDNKAFIISKYCLDNKLYSDEQEGITWETCSLRSWLNGDFYNMAFSADEQKIIENTDVKNNDNPIWGTNGGNDTIDKIFLLSLDEALNYFNLTKDENNESHQERMVYCYGDASSSEPTDYAVSQGLYVNDDGTCSWWLRSVGGLSGNGALEDGGVVLGGSENIGYTGTYGRDENGVRPALWVNTEGTTTTAEETTTTTETSTEAQKEKFADAVIMPKQNPDDVWGNEEKIEVRLNNGIHIYLPVNDRINKFTEYDDDNPQYFGGYFFDKENGSDIESIGIINCNTDAVICVEDDIERFGVSGAIYDEIPYNGDSFYKQNLLGEKDGKKYLLYFSPSRKYDDWSEDKLELYNAYADKIVSTAWVDSDTTES